MILEVMHLVGVSKSNLVKTYSELGFIRGEKPSNTKTNFSGKLATKYSVAEDIQQNVGFKFSPPNEYLSGRAKKISGNLEFDEELNINKLTGEFFVDVSSITMGEPDLDATLSGASMFHTSKFPKASFRIQRATKRTGES